MRSGGTPAASAACSFAAGGHVHGQALLVGQPQHGQAVVGLAGVDDLGVRGVGREGRAHRPAALAQQALVVDHQGGAVLLREQHEIAPAHREVPVGRDRC